MLAIAFDPSINHTGVCVARNGKVVYLGEIKTPTNRDDQDRLNHLGSTILVLCHWIRHTFPPSTDRTYINKAYTFNHCIVEGFENHRVNKMLSMMKASRAAGLIHGIMIQNAFRVHIISKGQIRKDQTRWLAIDRGVITKDAPDNIHNALDAYQLLVCAGVCK